MLASAVTRACADASRSSAYAVRWTFEATVGGDIASVLTGHAPDAFATSTSAKKACRRKTVRVNGSFVGVGSSVCVGDRVEVLSRTRAGTGTSAAGRRGRAGGSSERRLMMAYEDDHVAIAVKPDDVVTVGKGAEGLETWSAERMLATSCAPSGAEFGIMAKPRPCHRLDQRTGGLLVCAKTTLGMTSITAAFANRVVRKRYRAILRGRVENDEGVVNLPLSGREAITEYRVVKRYESGEFGALTLMDFFPKTGRTHQIRRHSATGLGCPIIGDTKFGDDEHPDGLFLWAVGISFLPSATPWRGEACVDLDVEMEEGEKFSRLLSTCV